MEWNKENLTALLDRNDQAVWRAVWRIYQRQTETERVIGDTCVYNGIGFNGSDARILSSFAEFYDKHKYLSKKQTAIARKKIKKYSRQLLEIIQEGE